MPRRAGLLPARHLGYCGLHLISVPRSRNLPQSRPSSPAVQEASAWAFAVRALRHRNYRLFFGGQSISLVGTWMTRIATAWLVYRLTHSAFLLGIVGFSGQIPIMLLGPFAGVWVDRWDRQRTLIVTQTLSMIQSFWLAALALAHIITVGDIIGLSLFQGAINAFDMPARQAFVVQMVEDRADLSNAIALNSSMVNSARLIGPSLAGIIIAAVGEGYCFLLDGISYMAVIASLLMMSIVLAQPRAQRTHVLRELKEGWQYVSRSTPIRAILLLLAVVSLVGMPYIVLMPIFAGKVLHGGPHTLGFLMGASGVGALTGAIVLATRRSVLGLGRVVMYAAMGFGAGLFSFASSPWLALSLPLMAFTGFCMMTQMASSNTILQTIVQEEKRGRVMSFYAMSLQGTAPFGSLIAGAAASRIGAPRTLMIGGSICVLGGLWFYTRLPKIRVVVRPIYRKLGIIPEVAAGMQAAASLSSPPED
jgi:MFS family permease